MELNRQAVPKLILLMIKFSAKFHLMITLDFLQLIIIPLSKKLDSNEYYFKGYIIDLI